MPAAHQRPSERTLESSDAGQESLVRPEPRGSVVVVHAEEGAGTGAAGAAGAETHNIHAFVHPREKRRLPALVSSFDGETERSSPCEEAGEEEGGDQSVFERGEEGGGGGREEFHIFLAHTVGRRRRGGGGKRGDMTGPCDLSALWKGACRF